MTCSACSCTFWSTAVAAQSHGVGRSKLPDGDAWLKYPKKLIFHCQHSTSFNLQKTTKNAKGIVFMLNERSFKNQKMALGMNFWMRAIKVILFHFFQMRSFLPFTITFLSIYRDLITLRIRSKLQEIILTTWSYKAFEGSHRKRGREGKVCRRQGWIYETNRKDASMILWFSHTITHSSGQSHWRLLPSLFDSVLTPKKVPQNLAISWFIKESCSIFLFTYSLLWLLSSSLFRGMRKFFAFHSLENSVIQISFIKQGCKGKIRNDVQNV